MLLFKIKKENLLGLKPVLSSYKWIFKDIEIRGYIFVPLALGEE